MSDLVQVSYNLDGNNILLTPSIVQQYIVSGNAKITIPEFKVFSEICKVRGLNPFLKEVYLIKYSDKEPAAIVVGKDAILKRAITNKNYDGMESGIIVTNEKDEVITREGTFKLPNEVLVGGWAKVHRKNWQYPTYVSVSFEEVAQRKFDGNLNANWGKKGATMVEKVAKVRALRETFIEDLGGLYEEEEMNVEIPIDVEPIQQPEQPQFNTIADVAKKEETIEVTSEEIDNTQLPFGETMEEKTAKHQECIVCQKEVTEEYAKNSIAKIGFIACSAKCKGIHEAKLLLDNIK